MTRLNKMASSKLMFCLQRSGVLLVSIFVHVNAMTCLGASSFSDPLKSCSVAFDETIETIVNELALFKINLNKSQVRGESAAVQSDAEQKFELKFEQLFKLLKRSTPAITREEIKHRVRSEIAKIHGQVAVTPTTELNEAGAVSERIEEQTRQVNELLYRSALGLTAVFQDVPLGEFKVSDRGPVAKFTKPVRMMQTKVTVAIWYKVKRLIEPWNVDFTRSDSYRFNRKPITMITPETIYFWLLDLNALSTAGDKRLLEIFPDWVPGTVYGLPSEMLWEYVATDGKGNQGNDVFKSKESFLSHAYINVNSGNHLRDVGELAPVKRGAGLYYDIYGNALEIVADNYKLRKWGGIDLLEFGTSTIYLVSKGAAYWQTFETAKEFRYDSIDFQRGGDERTGFRLISWRK